MEMKEIEFVELRRDDLSLSALTEEIVAYEKENDETHPVKKLDALCTPESFVAHSNFDTPGGTIYYIPKVSADVLLVIGNVYDSVDDCVTDEVSKYNYKELAMLYRLMLPLSQTNNHRKCVTVAAGLLKNETTKSYIWLLKAFIKDFRKAPSIVVTDQDGSIRNAIEAEYTGSKHRLCMWHITQKLPTNVFLSF
nr:hypothetical protein [Tanacetum cinerariifolium]